jgi:hypothetical protein
VTKADGESGSIAGTGENHPVITDEEETLDLAYLDFWKDDLVDVSRSDPHGLASRALVVLSKCFETDSLKLGWFSKKSLQADGPINLIIIIFCPIKSRESSAIWQFAQ